MSLRHKLLVGLVIGLAIGGCSGDLRSKVGTGVDADPLMLIDPPPCEASATPTDGTGDCTGGGHPGDDCLMCHHQGGGATPFTFAGTLYTDASGMTAQGGATIHVQDVAGNIDRTLSHPGNGNFYSTDGFVTYPAKAFVLLCPNPTAEMINNVDMTTGANCNTAGCHGPGFRLHF